MTIRYTASLALSALLLSACNKDDTSNPDGEGGNALLIVSVPITGTFASKGLLHQNAVIMALQQLTDGGYVEKTGMSLSLQVVNSGAGTDSASNIAAVQTSIQDLIDANTEDNGEIAIAAIISSTADAQQGSAPLAAKYGIPFFEASSGSGEDEFMPHQDADHPDGYTPEQESYLFGTRPLCDYEAGLTAKLIKEKWNGKRVAIVRGDEVHDIMHSETLRATLELDPEWTGTIVDSGDTTADGDYVLDYADTSYQDDIESVMTSGTPDVLFFHLRGDSKNLLFLQDANRADFQGAIPTCGMARGTALIDNATNGALSDYLVDRLFFVMRGPSPGAGLTAFKEDYKTMWAADSLEADTFTPMMYDATTLVALAMAQVGSVSDHVGLRDNLYTVSQGGTAIEYGGLGAGIDAILAGTDVDLQGVSGTLDVREDRSVPGSFYVEEVESNGDGTYKYTELPSPARVNL